MWDVLIEEIEAMNCYAGGGNSAIALDWVIDCSASFLSQTQIQSRLQNLINGMGMLIAECRFGA